MKDNTPTIIVEKCRAKHPDAHIRNPTDSDTEAILETPDETIVIGIDGDVTYLADDSPCPICPDDERHETGIGVPLESSYRKRREAACRHRRAALNAVSLDTEACPGCGAYRVEEYRHVPSLRPSQEVVSTFWCAECDRFRGCE